jgi:soluble lytic murein transglycosylase
MADSDARAIGPLAATAAGPAQADARDERWREPVRMSDFRTAEIEFDRVHLNPEAPSLRFLRARIAYENGDWAKVGELTLGLDDSLPEFSEDILRWARHAEAERSPSVSVALGLLAEKTFSEKLRGVELLSKLDRGDDLRFALDGLIGELPKDRTTDHARARRLRAEFFERQGESSRALVDYRWLATEAPLEQAAQTADEKAQQLGAPLTKQERYQRAEAFTRRGRIDDVLRELVLIDKAPGARPRSSELLRTQAWAYYKSRTDYAKASELFAQAAASDPTFRTQDLFYSARALSRANRDREAIERYRELVRRRPEGKYTEEARFLIARLQYLLGSWDDAVVGYTAYLDRHGSGRFADASNYERAIANLARGRGELAAPALGELTRSAGSERVEAMHTELHGVALMQQGKRAEAAQAFRRAIELRPLSFAALAAAARLVQLGEPPSSALAPSDPAPLPSRLVPELPRSVRLLASLGLDLDAERALRGRREEISRRYAPRGGEALCLAYGQLSVARERYRHAQRVVRERVLQRALTPATEWLWDCIYPRPYASTIDREAAARDVPASLVYAVMRQESAFAPDAESHAGAVGLMQLMPATAVSAAEELGHSTGDLDLRIPGQNIRLGTHYLDRLLRHFDGNVPLAVGSYNAGPAAMTRWLAATPGLALDLFVAHIPYEETRNYVQRVVGNWARYRYLEVGERGLPELDLTLPAPKPMAKGDY